MHLCSLLFQDNLNRTLSGNVPYPVDQHHLDDPHVKANLLFQVHMVEHSIGMPFCSLFTSIFILTVFDAQ
jgi:hypothetical protein